MEFIKEIIIVDDFSTDNSLDILENYELKYPKLIRIVSNKEKGGNNARNYGFSLSSGNYIQWLDSDDQLLPNKFEDQLAAFKQNKSVDIVYSDWRLDTYNNEGKIQQSEHKKHKAYDDFLYQLLIDNWSVPNTYLLRREIAEKLHAIKAWNPETKVLQDREYFTMAAILGAKFIYVPGFFSIYNRWNKFSVSAANKILRYENMYKLYCRLEEALKSSNILNRDKIFQYQKILSTQKILLNVYGYSLSIKKEKINIWNAHWPIVNGWRTRLKFILRLLAN